MRDLTPKQAPAASGERLRFAELMHTRSSPQLPEGDAWRYEVKFDGY